MVKTNYLISSIKYIDRIRFELMWILFLCAMPLLHGNELVIPDGTTTIADSQYMNRTDITSVKIPNSVKNISSSAFYGCSNLQSITIPNSVISIGDEAFSDCIGLTNITIPNSVTSIGYGAFARCSNLKSVTLPNAITSISGESFCECGSLESVTIPDGVTDIGWHAFYDCSNLKSVVIPNSVTDIEWAFDNCGAVTILTIPARFDLRSVFYDSYETIENIVISEGCTSIVVDAFNGCSSLMSITLPNSVTSIGNSAFSECGSLKDVVIPNSVTDIDESAFNSCGAVMTLTIPARFEIQSIFPNSYSKIKTVVISDGCTFIGDRAFINCEKLTSVTIPNSVTSIGDSAFELCKSLTSITIPDGCTSIGNRAFFNCEKLTSITIPDSVTSIGLKAFAFCTGLTSLTIPGNVTYVATSCFEDCKNLKILTFNCAGNRIYYGDDDVLIKGLDNLTDVYFNNSMPPKVLTFGTSKPVIHRLSTWNGYEVDDATITRLESKIIPLPATSGKVGQVLMVTADGYEWKDVPGGYSSAIADKFHLAPGWNLISLPEAELTASCKEELLKAYTFYKFDKNSKSYVSTDTLLPRSCYWVFAKDACTIHFTKAE